MNKTQWTDLFQTIKKTRVSFFSMTLFIVLAVGIYLGMNWSAQGTIQSVDHYLNVNRVHDVEIFSPTGLSDKDLQKIRSIDDVSDVVGIYHLYGYYSRESTRYHASIVEITDQMDCVQVYEGTLPEKEDEMAMDLVIAEDYGFQLGDTITFEEEGMGYLNTSALKNRTYTLTALIVHSSYACNAIVFGSAPIDGINIDVQIYLPECAFDTEHYEYTTALVLNEKLESLFFSDEEYKNSAIDLKERILGELEDTDPGCFGYTLASLTHTYSATIVHDTLENLGKSLAVLFLVLGFFVCYSTLSRIIYSQIKEIAIQKVYGFSEKEILKKYLWYTGISTAIGFSLGLVISFAVELILLKVIQNVYYVTELALYMNGIHILILCVLEFLVLLLITWFSIRTIVYKRTVLLLAGESEDRSNEVTISDLSSIGWIRFKRSSAFKRMLHSNAIHDKRRVLGTIISIAGCTALIVAATTFYLNVNDSIHKTFRDYLRFDDFVLFNEENDDCMEKLHERLDELGIENAPVRFEISVAELPDGVYGRTFMMIPQDEDFMKLVSVEPADELNREISTGAPNDPASDGEYRGVWYGNQYPDYYGQEETDSVKLITTEYEADFEIDSYFYNYLPCYVMILDKESYRENTGLEPICNAFILDSNGMEVQELSDAIADIDGFVSILDFYQNQKGNFRTVFSVVAAISSVYLVMAFIMCFLVLLNILIQFVEEKKREIITLSINGYERKDTRRYIYRDTIVMTIVGTIFGIGIGSWIGIVSVASFDSGVTEFLKAVSLPSILIGAVVTAGLSAWMCFIAMKKIDTFKLSDINV